MLKPRPADVVMIVALTIVVLVAVHPSLPWPGWFVWLGH